MKHQLEDLTPRTITNLKICLVSSFTNFNWIWSTYQHFIFIYRSYFTLFYYSPFLKTIPESSLQIAMDLGNVLWNGRYFFATFSRFTIFITFSASLAKHKIQMKQNKKIAK